MPFRRTYRRYKKSSKLTKANIYSNRGAKAQSKQIAALNRKVNYLAKANRPEIRIMYRNAEYTFTNGALSGNYGALQFGPWAASYTGDDQAGSDTTYFEGNFCRCKGISLKCIAQYSDNWRDTIADAAHDSNAGYRIVILQRRTAIPITGTETSAVPAISDVFLTTSNTSSDDTNLTLPLVSGITSSFKVLYSKVFTISRFHSTRQHNIYIPASRCLNFQKDVSITANSIIGKGQIYVCFLTGGLHHDIDYTAQIHLAATLKIAFTDN